MSNEFPKISVITPTYNRPSLLYRTLDSIMKQSYPGIIECVIVNDAGAYPFLKIDGAELNYIRNFTELNGIRKFRYLENGENRGLAGTRNVAMEKATGDYFVFLDDDDMLLPYALEFRMYMVKKLNAEIVYTRALQDIWEKTSQGYTSVHKQLYWDCHFDKDLILIQNIAPCNCPLFSRKAWDDSGNYQMDENLDTSEDFDFWIALSRRTHFHELKLIDAECSIRKDGTQMTGVRNFSNAYPIIYKRWRETAINLKQVIEHQNNVLKNMGINPENYGL
jgi:glycosyltransferase involved in cell wall biosynthesis